MAWTFIESNGNFVDKTSGSDHTLSLDATIAVGEIAIAVCVSDNRATASGESNDHTSITDVKSNTWVKIKEWTKAAGSAGDGVTSSLWYSVITTELLGSPTFDSVTIHFSGAITSKAFFVNSYSIAAGNTVLLAGANGNSGTSLNPTVTLSSLTSAEYLWLGSVGAEGPDSDAFTQDADYGHDTLFGTLGGANLSNVYTRNGDRIFTGTTDTYSPTLGNSRDYAAILGALQEVVSVSSPPKNRFNVEKLRRPSPKGTIYA